LIRQGTADPIDFVSGLFCSGKKKLQPPPRFADILFFFVFRLAGGAVLPYNGERRETFSRTRFPQWRKETIQQEKDNGKEN
jgi:hypothetical protein